MFTNSYVPAASETATFTSEESVAFSNETVAAARPFPVSSFTWPRRVPPDCARAEKQVNKKKPNRKKTGLITLVLLELPAKLLIRPETFD